MMNGLLAGLVSVTGSCAIIDETAAMFIGFIGSGIFFGSSLAIEKFKIDDPLDAFPVHGCCGIWGMLSIGIFATHENIRNAGYNEHLIHASTGYRFSLQLFAVVLIAIWTIVHVIPVFWLLSKTNNLRVSLLLEESGLDWAEHGATADVRRLQTQHGVKHIQSNSHFDKTEFENIQDNDNDSNINMTGNHTPNDNEYGLSMQNQLHVPTTSGYNGGGGGGGGGKWSRPDILSIQAAQASSVSPPLI